MNTKPQNLYLSFKQIPDFFKQYWSCLLIILTIVGFISKALYNYPFGIMAIIGLYRLIVSPKEVWRDDVQKFFIFSFLCLWLPLIISFPDSVNHNHAAHTVFPYLRFLFAGLFIIQELSKDRRRLNFIIFSIFIIVTFWSIDASIQFFFGENLLGYPYKPGEISGMFYPRNTISHICSILSTFVFIYIYKNKDDYKWLWLSLIPLFFIILLSGRRAAWIMLALSSFVFFIYIYIYSVDKKQLLKMVGIIVACLSLVLITTIFFNKPLNNRFKVTLGLFSADYEIVDQATARRLPLWETAFDIFKANPINGIGPRGYRHVYQEYAKPDNYWFDLTQTHPHLLILEIMAETGLVGIVGYLLLLYLLIKHMWQSRQRRFLIPLSLPVFIALVPFNAHMAFYGSIWSSMLWWLTAVYFANMRLLLNNRP